MRSDIPVSEFPDYVLDMTVENQHNKSKLAIEYQVGSMYIWDRNVKQSFKFCSNSVVFLHCPTKWPVFPRTQTSIDSGTFTHVRKNTLPHFPQIYIDNNR